MRRTKSFATSDKLSRHRGQNFFKGLEIYFSGSEIYFQVFEIYFGATKKVSLRAAPKLSSRGVEFVSVSRSSKESLAVQQSKFPDEIPDMRCYPQNNSQIIWRFGYFFLILQRFPAFRSDGTGMALPETNRSVMLFLAS